VSTRLTRSQVQKWSDEAHTFMADSDDGRGDRFPACTVIDTVGDVADLCDALLEAWSDYHAHPAAESVVAGEPGSLDPDAGQAGSARGTEPDPATDRSESRGDG
jgi:hypothetical protein